MKTDIVERLRYAMSTSDGGIGLEAADEIKLLRQRVAELEDQIDTGFYGRMSAKLQQQLAACEKERDHWKANHDNRVAAARLLHYRLDLPLERVKAYEKYVEMQDRLAECQQYLKDDETPAERMARYHHDIQGLLGQLATAKEQRDELRDALSTLLSLEEESLRGDDDIDVCLEIRVAREALTHQAFSTCPKSTTEDCSEVQTKGEK